MGAEKRGRIQPDHVTTLGARFNPDSSIDLAVKKNGSLHEIHLPQTWLNSLGSFIPPGANGVGIGGANGQGSEIGQRFWQDHAVVPFETGDNLDPEGLAKLAESMFNPDGTPRSTLDSRRIAHPHTLVPVEVYKETDPKDYMMARYFAENVRNKNLKIFEISATDEGGGVSKLMHRKINLMQQLGIRDRWGVQSDDDPSRYEITKGDIHNLLQDVAEPGRGLNPEKVGVLTEWAKKDFFELWEQELRDADIVVIHDPQPNRFFDLIRKLDKQDQARGINKRRIIIYRSHTQPDGEKADTPGTPQHSTWNALWQNGIEEADLFITHPLPDAVPAIVPREKVVAMGAVTDRFDGLTRKSLPEALENKLVNDINKIVSYQEVKYKEETKEGIVEKIIEVRQEPIDWERGYVLQFARWDESKGIPELVKHYREYRNNEIRKGTALKDIKQLVIAGNKASDDPSAAKVFKEVYDLVQSPEYVDIRDDIKLLLLPHIDFMANVLMRLAAVYVQNSKKEGYEVLAKEALIAEQIVLGSKEGGIKLQLRPATVSNIAELTEKDIEGKDSFLIDPYDHKTAGAYLSFLLDPRNKGIYEKMRRTAGAHGREPRDTTMQNMVNWLYLYDIMSSEQQVPGNFAMVHDLAEAEYDRAMRELSALGTEGIALTPGVPVNLS